MSDVAVPRELLKTLQSDMRFWHKEPAPGTHNYPLEVWQNRVARLLDKPETTDYQQLAQEAQFPEVDWREVAQRLATVCVKANEAIASVFSASPQLGEGIQKDIGLTAAIAEAKELGLEVKP